MHRAGFSSWVSLALLLLILVFYSGPGSFLFGLAGFPWLGWRLFQGRAVGQDCRWKIRFFSGSAVLLVLLSIYYFNPSHEWMEGVGALPVAHTKTLPATAFRPGTLGSLWFAVVTLAAAGLAMDLCRKKVDGLIAAVATASAVTALAVLGQRLSPRPFAVFDLTGFFPYENHFAAFANLVLPVVLFAGTRHKIRAFESGKLSSPSGLFFFAAGLLVAAVALSRSRAGLLISCLILAVFIARQLRLRRLYPLFAPPLPRWVLPGAGAIFALIAAGVFFWQRFSRIGEELSFRGRILMDTFSVWRDNPVWGSGPGSFSAVFPYYQSLPAEKYSFLHAHCEPLQFLAEYGILGTGILLISIGWILLLRGDKTERDEQIPPFRELEGKGLWLALAGIGLHSLIDFPLRHPLNALLTVVWIGILTVQLSGNKTQGSTCGIQQESAE